MMIEFHLMMIYASNSSLILFFLPINRISLREFFCLPDRNMFVKINPLISSTRNISWIFKRNYNMKKLSLQTEKNPQVKKIFEEKFKRKQQQSVLDKLVNKRYVEYSFLIRHPPLF